MFSMYGAYQRLCRTTSTRVQFYERMLDFCGLIDDPGRHKSGRHRELERAEIKKSEKAVVRTITAIRNFTNPFSLDDKYHLYNLASDAPVPSEAEHDVLHAEAIGKESKLKFTKERFIDGSSQELFFERIKKQKLRKMSESNKVVKFSSSPGKVSSHDYLLFSHVKRFTLEVA